jgi:DNA polymerase
MASVLHGDFETRSACDLKVAGADLYARHSSTEVLCFGYQFDDDAPQIVKYAEKLPQRVLDHIASGGIFVAHNAPFELAVWNHTGTKKYGWPSLKPEQMCCTMCMSMAMALPASLDKSAAAMGIDQQKDQKGYRVMLQMSQPREILPWGEIVWWEDPEKFEKLYEYCLQDVRVEHELYTRLLHLSPKEKEVWILDQEINQRGIQIDLPAVRTAISLVENEKKRLDIEMRKITHNQVATCQAVSQLTSWITMRGIGIEGVAKADITALLENADLPADIRKALLLRQEAAKSSNAKLISMLESADQHGRIRGIFQYHGAGTGRWAGRRIQPQNFPRNQLLEQKEIDEVLGLLGGVGWVPRTSI